jgi:hypothetical protein
LRFRFVPSLLVIGLLAALPAISQQASNPLSEFSDPSRVWGTGVEAVIEEAYRLCFRTYIIGGKMMNLRMPFAQNHERETIAGQAWELVEGGKGDPAALWLSIGGALRSGDFQRYIEALSDGREKVIIFDMPNRNWSVSRDFFDIARMKADAYRQLPHQPWVLVPGRSIGETDVYNYLYCVGWVGMDCSGFVWNVLSSIARSGGADLTSLLGPSLGAPPGSAAAYYVGTWFFNSNNRALISVADEIRNLRPADILLFRGADGGAVHSAIIQSVNLQTGVIRYLQSTDEAPPGERGVHESFIYFDPAHPELSLKDSSVRWAQKRYPPFPGEISSPFSDDGERYRAYGEYGGGRVVRLRALEPVIEKLGQR